MTARREWTTAGLGLVFGVVLSRTGFSSWDEVHALFTLVDARLFGTFATATLALAIVWAAARARGHTFPARPVHPGTIAGGVVFGVGWALSGACPAVALVQLGELQLGALATLLGIGVGNYVYARVHERHFRWTQASCTD